MFLESNKMFSVARNTAMRDSLTSKSKKCVIFTKMICLIPPNLQELLIVALVQSIILLSAEVGSIFNDDPHTGRSSNRSTLAAPSTPSHMSILATADSLLSASTALLALSPTRADQAATYTPP